MVFLWFSHFPMVFLWFVVLKPLLLQGTREFEVASVAGVHSATGLSAKQSRLCLKGDQTWCILVRNRFIKYTSRNYTTRKKSIIIVIYSYPFRWQCTTAILSGKIIIHRLLEKGSANMFFPCYWPTFLIRYILIATCIKRWSLDVQLPINTTILSPFRQYLEVSCSSLHQETGEHVWLGVLTILKKWESMGRIVPYIMENNKCLKPPTSEHVHFPFAAGCLKRHTYILSPLGSIGDILELPPFAAFARSNSPSIPWRILTVLVY